MSAARGINEQGVVEIKVETVDYRSSAGHDKEPPKKEKVEVIHRMDENPENLAEAAAAAKDRGTEEINEQGVVEIKVETVDYRSSAGHDKEPPKKEKVEVIHQIEENPDNLAEAAAAAKDTIQSVKDAGK